MLSSLARWPLAAAAPVFPHLLILMSQEESDCYVSAAQPLDMVAMEEMLEWPSKQAFEKDIQQEWDQVRATKADPGISC